MTSPDGGSTTMGRALSVAAHISTGIVRVVREYTGRGPTRARTTIDHDMVTVLMGDTLTHGERTLATPPAREREGEAHRGPNGGVRHRTSPPRDLGQQRTGALRSRQICGRETVSLGPLAGPSCGAWER